MSEEEIIKYIKDEIENEIDTFHWFDNTPKNETRGQIEESIKAHQGLLDLYNKEKLNSFNLSEQLNKEKEKNTELENCLQMAKQIMTADISENFDCMKLKEFKEYLLNEIKLNENFEE